jgi:PKD repeat protein
VKLRTVILLRCAAIAVLLVTGNAKGIAQVLAGIRANGRIMNNGDTVFICKNNTVNYQTNAINATSYRWTFKNGTPTNSLAPNPGNVNYTTAGIDSTIQVVNNVNGADSMFIYVKVSDDYPKANFSFSPDNVCGNIPINFTNSSTGNGLSFFWNFGDGATSTQMNPTHSFLNAIGPPGTQTYSVKLVVTNREGCKDSISKPVTIKKVPDAAIGNADASVQFAPFNGVPTFRKCSNLPFYSFSFNNQSTTISGNVSYKIIWGDAAPDSIFTSWPAGVVITHTYPLGGKTMTVEVTGPDGCIGIKNYLVFLGSTPSGGLASLGNEDVCEKDTLKFELTNFAGNPPGTIYSFQVNDGSPAQVFQHPPPNIISHNFTRSSCGVTSTSGQDSYANAFGAYLTIQNPCGSKSPSVVPIYVSGRPIAAIRAAGIVCAGTPVLVQSTSQFGVNPATGCTNTGVQVWTVTPATGYTVAPAFLGSLNGQPGNSLAWTNGPNSFTINFNTPGTYTIKLYISNQRCGVDSSVKVICVRNAPQASFAMSRDSSCGPGDALFTNTSPVGGCTGDSYNWQVVYQDPLNCGGIVNPTFEFINNTTATTPSPQIQFNRPGRYIITLTTRANGLPGGCAPAIARDTFVVKGKPKVTLTPPPALCPGNTITPVASVSLCYSNGPIGYEWTFAGGSPASSGLLNPGPVLYATTGNYAITLAATDSSCPFTTTVTDTVRVVNPPAANAGPDKEFCSGVVTAIGSAPVAGLTYKWTPVTFLSNPNIANPQATLTYNGPAADTVYKYYVDVTASPTCKSSDTVLLTVKRKPVVFITPPAVNICKDSSILLTASGADSYVWLPGGATTAAITVNPTGTTTYSVTGTLANGCDAVKTATVNVSDKAKAEFALTDTVFCINVDLKTIVRVTPYPTRNLLYRWYVNGALNNPNTTGAPPDSLITTPGNFFTIKLVTTSSAGCAADSMELRFRTRPSASAQFSKDTASGCGPLRVNFTNRSAPLNNTAQYFWLFGNGATSNLQQPGTVTYLTSPAYRDTTYYITLKAYTGCDTSYYRDSVKVFPGPGARFSVTPTTGCSPFTFKTINNSLGNNTAYYWDFDDGTRDTTFLRTDTLQHTYNVGIIDTFRIRLIAVNGCGRDTQYLSVIVSPATIQPIIVVGGPSLFGCAPHNAVFTNNSVGAATLTWNFGDGSALVTTPNIQSTVSHLYTLPGTYNVIVRLKNDCTDTSVTRQIVVYAPPKASFTLNRNLICPGETVTATSTATNANALEWLWGDGTSSSGSPATHVYNTAGVYNIKLVAKRVNNFGLVCSDTSLPQAVTAQANIAAVIKIDSTSKFCAPYVLNVTAQGAAGASIVRWTFYDPAAPTGSVTVNGVTASYAYNLPGSYAVKLFTQNAAGCKDSATQNFTVYPVPTASFTPGNLSTCFTDTIVRYTATYSYAWTDPVSLRWFVNAQPAGAGTILNYQFRLPPGASRPYTFTIKLLPQNVAGCGDTTSPASLTLKPVPQPGIKVLPGYVQQQPNYTFNFADTFATSPNYVYSWDMGDRKPLQNQRSFNYTYGDTGTYKVLLRLRDFATGCIGSDSARVTVLYVPGYLYVPNAFYPDSRKNELTEFKPVATGLSSYHLRIYDTWGKLLFESKLLDADGKPAEAWTGRDLQRAVLPGDAYVWIIDATFKNGLRWDGMVYDKNPASGPPMKPTRQGFVRLFR